MVDDVWENPLYNISCGHALWAVIAKKPGGASSSRAKTRSTAISSR